MKELKIIAKVGICTYEELQNSEKKLTDEAKAAARKAYAPYSEFQVGAAVLLTDGTIITGNNQENVAYPSGICAERVAMFYANARYPEQHPVMLAVAAYSNGKFSGKAVSPCGACRQVLLETETRFKQPLRVLLYGEEEIIIIESVGDLLPLGFGS